VASAEEFEDAPEVTSGEFPATAGELVQHLRDVLALPAEEFYELEAKSRGRAFTVSGVAELDLVTDVWRAVESAVTNGETLDDFKARIGEDLEQAWGGEIPGRIETIFRTNVQAAYGAGRYHQNNRPEVRATHPFCRFTAVMDSRTSDICEALDGTVLPSDDDFWATHQPPLHFNCRSDVSAITEEEAREAGVDELPPQTEPDEGFGVPITDWKPDLSSRPVELVTLYELKLNEEGSP
jgi:SPP1 gp7 family putative phage head morphogenesis protein